jgi:hypothetical protein
MMKCIGAGDNDMLEKGVVHECASWVGHNS